MFHHLMEFCVKSERSEHADFVCQEQEASFYLTHVRFELLQSKVVLFTTKVQEKPKNSVFTPLFQQVSII